MRALAATVPSSTFFSLLVAAAVVAASPALAAGTSATKVHVVGRGQNVGSIAKRYGVSVRALLSANDLGAKSSIRPGQKLTIPESRAVDKISTDRKIPGLGSSIEGRDSGSLPAVVSHRVARGETLSQLALRYDTRVDTIQALNRLKKTQGIRVGQVLTVPARESASVSSLLDVALPHDASSRVPRKAGRGSWSSYVRPPQRRGHLDISNPITRYVGPAVDSKGRLLPGAVRALNNLLGAGGRHPALPERLIRLLVTISDTFGGRSMRVVSGYRTTSYYSDSRHKLSSAVDFTIAGVPNAVVCEYLRGFDNVGVGYYPNSTFVHLDVRGHSAYWVDYSGPGEAPRSSPNAPRRSPTRKPAVRRPEDRKMLAELDALLGEATLGLERSSAEKANGARRTDAPPPFAQE